MQIAISKHNGGNNIAVGTLTVRDAMSDSEIAKVVDEAGGWSDLCAMAETSTIPAGYEWTGDEVYEIV
ncbi:MAG: hypothetical protein KGL39_26240 [Patescibacteria group bacterium]|nr:hypothetical protein [Patescibacteria group bacterium]